MSSRALSTGVLLAATLGFSCALRAQHAKTPTLEDILGRLEANLNHYDTSVPSLFCDEHVVSSQMAPKERDQSTITDSVFRLKRTSGPDHRTTLAESREIRSIDGKPATSQNMDGPTLLSGAFEGGLDVVSLNQTACMNYELQPINRRRPTEPYVVRFSTIASPRNPADCLLQEKSKGRVFIDPATMQVTHLELNTPRHTIVRGDSFTSPVVGKRVITVDYAPVMLGGETFWMPSSINMRVVSGAGTFHMVVWSYQATYRNYHKMEVTSRILPGIAPAP
jgi:hypothetical protein